MLDGDEYVRGTFTQTELKYVKSALFKGNTK